MRVEIYEVRVGFYEVRRRLDRRRRLRASVHVPGVGTRSQVLTLATLRRSPWTSVAGTGPVRPTQPINTAAQRAGGRYRPPRPVTWACRLSVAASLRLVSARPGHRVCVLVWARLGCEP